MALLAATVQPMPSPRHRSHDVLQVIAGLRKQNPRAGESRLAELLADEILDDRDLAVDAGRHLIHRALVSAKPKSPAKVAAVRRQRAARQEVEREVVTAVAEKVKDLVALDMMVMLLDGTSKALRFCFGRELSSLSTAYQRIATAVGADVMVGEALTSAEAQALMGAVV
jgi:hypothetical protein